MNKLALGILGLGLLGMGFAMPVGAPLSGASATVAPTPTPPLGHWTRAENGPRGDWELYLSGSDISGIAVDGEVLWAASAGGLLRWDRTDHSVTQYLAPDFPLPGNKLSAVLLDEGRLYIGSGEGVAIFDRGDQWISYTPDEIGLTLGYSCRMAIVEGTLWVSGEGGLARLSPNGKWTANRYKELGLPETLFGRFVPLDDALYFVVPLGLKPEDAWEVYRYAGSGWEKVERPELRYWATPDGGLWKVERDGVLFKSIDRVQTWDPVLELAEYSEIGAVDSQGRLYIARDDAIQVVETVGGAAVGETYRFFDAGPRIKSINLIRRDAQGRLWVGTDGLGLSMFDGQQWYNWQGVPAIHKDLFRAIAVADQKVYAGTFGCGGCGGVGILDIESGEWTNLQPGESPLSGGGVGGIAVDAQGRAYFLNSKGILDIYDGKQWDHIAMPISETTTLPEGQGVNAIAGAIDAAGHYWAAVDGLGIWKYDGERWENYQLREMVNTLAFDAQGRLWVGTRRSLWVRETDGMWWQYDILRAKLPLRTVEDLAVDPEGRVWMVETASLVAFNGEAFQRYQPSLVGNSKWGSALEIDGQGRVWVTTGAANGLAVYSGEPEIGPWAGLKLEPQQRIPDAQLMRTFALLELPEDGRPENEEPFSTDSKFDPTLLWIGFGTLGLFSAAGLILFRVRKSK